VQNAGRKRGFSDGELRFALNEGKKPREIAVEYGVSPQAVYKRINHLRLTTTASVVEYQPNLSTQVDAMQQLARSLERVNLLMDACDEWLRDANRPDRYNIELRAGEIMVTYMEAVPGRDGSDRAVKRRDNLQALLDLALTIDKVDSINRSATRMADPRELVLKTSREIRMTVSGGVELARLIADAQSMQVFRDTILAEIAKVSPKIAGTIAEAVRRCIVLRGAAEAPASLSSRVQLERGHA
jgi:hypothetical protein